MTRSAIALLCGLIGAAAASADEVVDFPTQVQPVLAGYCVRCHGPEKQESGLRLDSGRGILEGGNTGPTIVPGKSGESLLIQVVTGASSEFEMPPDGPTPTAEEVALVARWIDQGAMVPPEALAPEVVKGRDHWSFQPIVRREPPAVAEAGWVRTPIDAFILARLEAEGIRPSSEADRATLIRRLSLDLLGLPPSPAEVEEFLADTRTDAYEQLVDRLLASPHYGERQARHWLDLARYADSNGFTIDGPRSIWKYRDWVIDALNRDLAFDQFVIEQLAGDMLPEATPQQIVATGFHRNTLINQEGGTDPEQFRVESVVDRVNTTGSVLLGLTIGCAQCHSHKYDPISQREYYQFFAFFNGADEPSVLAPSLEQSQELETIRQEMAAAERALAEHDAAQAGRQADWENRYAALAESLWTVLDPVEFRSVEGATITKLEDRSLLLGGTIPATDTYVVTADAPPGVITAVRVEALTHNTVSNGGPGLRDDGNFSLTEFSLAAAPRSAEGTLGEATPVPLAAALADDAQPDRPISQTIDGNQQTAWSFNFVKGTPNTNHRAVFVFQQDAGSPGGVRLTFTLDHKIDLRPGLGRFQLAVASASRETLALDEALRAILRVPAEQRTAQQLEQLAAEFRKTDAARAPLAERIARLKAREREIVGNITTTMVMQERPQPRETHIHIRGDFLSHGALVQPNVPAVLPGLPTAIQRPSRLDLARWLVDGANPLTPRVTMNRAWQQFFGVGLVDTENDFGTQGSPPTHPELLDWLASEFVQCGWGLKAMHRLIVTSAVYRQSSHGRPDLATIDPRNRLLARQGRLRLDAEVIRDSALGASGLLSRTIGGPGVFPPQPGGIYRFTQQDKQWKDSQGQDRFRRGMYTYFWRSSPYPFLMTFDGPNGNVTCTRRVRSNTPLQALHLANDLAFFEMAQGLATRLTAEAPTEPSQRIQYAFRLCFARQPDDRELARLLEFYQSERARFEASPADADAVAPAGRPEGMPAAEAAAWTSTARVLFNLDEFVNRE